MDNLLIQREASVMELRTRFAANSLLKLRPYPILFKGISTISANHIAKP